MRVLKRWRLPNGLELEALDLSENYWADFWNLRVLIRAKVPVPKGLKEGREPLAKEAWDRLGDEVLYEREIVKVGVREGELREQMKDALRNFEENALPYLAHPDFPRRFVMRRFEEALKKLKIERMKEEDHEAEPEDL